LELLVNLKVTLEARTDIKPKDRKLIMQLSPLYLEQLQAAEQKGKLEGEQLGEQRGEQRGQQQKQQEIALNLLQENVPMEIVSRTTGLTIEQLEQLRSN
jgi:predicted transposase/invertase (TIGR01784 family)